MCNCLSRSWYSVWNWIEIKVGASDSMGCIIPQWWSAVILKLSSFARQAFEHSKQDRSELYQPQIGATLGCPESSTLSVFRKNLYICVNAVCVWDTVECLMRTWVMLALRYDFLNMDIKELIQSGIKLYFESLCKKKRVMCVNYVHLVVLFHPFGKTMPVHGHL
jgi:hypothetical protein